MKGRLFFLTTTLVLFCASLHAQRKVIKTEKGEYQKDSRLNKYLGSWEYRNDNDVFIVRLFAAKIEGPNGLTMDVIKGCYNFTQNKLEYNDILQNCDLKKNRLVGSIKHDAKDILNLIYWDDKKRQKGTAKINFLSNKQSRIKWSLGLYEGEKLQIITDESERIFFGTDFAVPTDVIMERID
ncbi:MULTISPECIES: DUF6705 family protein [Flavobacteriaceae]|uniref:DUF6705 family protein n=1 Tax=Flavobacteriaceae TaxID=49546 RepID=UPI0014916621|nr:MULTISPECIES: DUF6705 family protein [Allomuricauda]MDC6364504.1 hypothetical protein [Muricauda sp. AC10]